MLQIRCLTTLTDVSDVDTIIVPVWAPLSRSTELPGIDNSVFGRLFTLAEDARFTAKSGTTQQFPLLAQGDLKRLIFAGLGAEGEITVAKVQRAAGAALQAARNAGAVAVAVVVPETGISADTFAQAWATGAELGLYRFMAYYGAGHPEDQRRPDPESLSFLTPSDLHSAVAASAARGQTIAEAVCLARDLVNEPAASMTPAAFAEKAVTIAAQAGLEIEVLDVPDLQRLGANAILGVGQGSDNPPRMLRLRYRPAPEMRREPDRLVGLVGKCITFDTGGYSIKTYEGMLEMKGDMAGGAAVLATMSALRALGCPLAVDATICAAENMISGSAFRPGDILTALNGITIEVLSTDAEGRLVLADGLVDAARHGATELIDVATLTGAIMVALGDGATGLFSTNDLVANGLLKSSAAVGERFWRMPLFDELNERIRGDVGDIKNSGGRHGGAITAALFLKRFSEGLPWAHLDIAGASRFEKAGPLGPKGGSGVTVMTLINYLTGD